MAYKIITGKISIPKDQFFRDTHSARTRAKHNMKLQTYKPRGNIDKFAFAQRTVPEWNNLPAHIVNANTVESFRTLLTEYLADSSSPTD